MYRPAVPFPIFLLVLGSAGCLPALIPPDRGGASWREIVSPHFIVRTDVPSADARALVSFFEEQYQILTNEVLTTPQRSADPRTEVVLFSRVKDYYACAPKHSAGYTATASPLQPEDLPTIVLPAGAHGSGRHRLDDRTRRVFLHELTHRILLYYAPQVPRWLTEGLAQYIETMEIDKRRLVLGRPPYQPSPDFLARLPTMGQLLRSSPEDFHTDSPQAASYYFGAWGLVHMLYHRDRERFASYLDLLARGIGRQDAWSEAFGQPGPDARTLATALGEYLSQNRLPGGALAYNATPVAFTPTERPFPARDVHLLWARLALAPGFQATALAEVAALRRLAPEDPEVLYAETIVQSETVPLTAAEAKLRRAVEQAPKEPRYWYLLGETLLGRAPPRTLPEVLKDVAEHLAPLARRAREFDFLARYHGLLRQPDAGLVLAERAIATQPTCWRCYLTRAGLLALARRYPQALDSALQAAGLAPESLARSQQERLARVVQGLRRQALLEPSTAASGASPGDGAAAPATTAPATNEATVSPEGVLDKETIRGVIRSHVGEVKTCFELGLAQRPGLSGRVVVQFRIAQAGAVAASIVESSTLQDAGVEECIARVVRSWRFPAPKGSNIFVVNYPFVLKPEDRADAPSPSPAAPSESKAVPQK